MEYYLLTFGGLDDGTYQLSEYEEAVADYEEAKDNNKGVIVKLLKVKATVVMSNE